VLACAKRGVRSQAGSEKFEGTELRFVEKLLRPDRTVLDIGANHDLGSVRGATVNDGVLKVWVPWRAIDLWVRFFRYARLYSVDALIGGYRFRSDAISARDIGLYNQRCDKIIESELNFIPRAGAVKAFRRVSSVVMIFPTFGDFDRASP
jgi:hypothetical protein